MKKSFYWSVMLIAGLLVAGAYSTNVFAEGDVPTEPEVPPAVVEEVPAPVVEEETEPVDLDADEDGVNDDVDNCPADANADQADADADGVGDACDDHNDSAPVVEDADADGVEDAIDNCIDIANPDQLDTDANGTGDACEASEDDAGGDDGEVEGAFFSRVMSIVQNNPEPDQCGESYTYTFSSGGQNNGDDSSKPANIDYHNTQSQGNPDSLTVSADAGFQIIKVEVSVDDDGQPGFTQIATGPITNVNPSGTTIHATKVTVKKVCPDVCPNIEGDQYEVPEDMIVDGNGQCVIPPKEITISTSKIICASEADLPNWSGNEVTIGATTAEDYVANSDGQCWLAKGWEFEWSYSNIGNPGDNTPNGGAGWNTFMGSTVVDIANDQEIHVREVTQEGFIPFAGGNDDDAESAEMYCADDVLNYDNWDFIRKAEADETYHCVAWNVSEVETSLTVVKLVENLFGGDATPSDFNLNVTWYTGNSNDESEPWRGFLGDENGTTFDVNPGNFLVGEDWTMGYSMVIDTNAGPRCAGGQTLHEGEDITCTVINKELPYGGNDEPMCDLEGEGWYGEYFNYPKSREDMYSIYEADPVAGDDGLFTMKWGQPINSGDTAYEWYDVDGDYFRFSRVDSNLEFGDMFWPFYGGLVEEETYGSGRDFNFGVHWSATVDVPSDATPADYYTYGKFDDDVFVYVNGVLDLDSSATGVHGPVAVTGTLNLKDGDVIDVYYADRAQGESSMYLEFINNTDEEKGNEIFFAPYNDDCNLVCDPKVNLIKNGGFEAPVLADNSWSIFTSPTMLLEWLTGSEGIEIQNSAAGSPFAGEQLAELDPNHPTTIWQDIPTIPGATYRLETQYSPRPGRGTEDNRFEFRVDGSTVGASVARDGSANGDTVWTLESRTFVAASTTTSVGFAEVGTDTSYGAYLDEVGLYCVLETPEDTATVTICKYDEQDNKLGGWTVWLEEYFPVIYKVVDEDTHDFEGVTASDGEGFGCVTFNNVPYGDYDLGENMKIGWGFISSSEGENNYVTVDSATEEFSIVNGYRGHGDDDDDDDDTTITVNKVINVESSQEFNFFLDGSESAFATLNGGETSGPVVVTPGSHSVGEGLVEGWNLTDITCLNEAEEEVGSIDGPMYLTLEDGDDIICTFTNTFQNGGNDETPNDTPNDDSNGRSGSNRNSFRGRGEVLGATTDTNFCPFLRDYQHINTENDPSEVNKAKAFFNSYLGLNLLLNGVFDMPMFNAVVQFQNMFKPDVLDTWTEEFPSLDDNATGYLYQTTKWKINSIICPGYETFPDQLIMAPGTTVN